VNKRQQIKLKGIKIKKSESKAKTKVKKLGKMRLKKK
jgi:hypothetical protein